MILFSNEKEIIFKITNAVLLIWLVAAMAITCGSIINLVIKEPVQNYTYSEYELTNCLYYKEDKTLTPAVIGERCKVDYNNYKFQNRNNDYYKLITSYTSIANILIVGGVMYFINKKAMTK